VILQRLAEHYDRIAASTRTALAPPGYSLQNISFCVVLEADGRLNSFESLMRAEGKAQRPSLLIVPGQSKPPGSGLNPCFLWDNMEYLLGFSVDPAKAARAPRAFEALRQAHLAREEAIAHPAFSAVCTFLRSWSAEQMQSRAEELTPLATHFGVFRLAGERQYVHELVTAPESIGETTSAEELATCLVTGELSRTARLHEPRIKGVAGAQTSGALLVSFNSPAFTSYGKDQSFNAPVSISSTFKYTNALNHLLAQRERRILLGDATVVFWADHASPLEDCMAALFGVPTPLTEQITAEDPERIRAAELLLTQMRDGTANATIPRDDVPTRFFILGLSPNASRLSVRLWVEESAAELERRLGEHVRDLALKGGRGDRPLPLWRIVAATGRAEHDPAGKLKGFDTKAVSPQLAGDLTRSVLTGCTYPQSLLTIMIRRIRSDGEVAFVRVSAIKACLVRNSRLRGAPLEVAVELDAQNTDVAYRCGRLFALLEKAQSDSAGGELNSTIKDRYFSSASTTPALVFPRLFRLNGHHLAKLETGGRIFYERQMASAMAGSFDFPRQLSLIEQGRFIVGYFQQRQNLYTKRDKAPQENA
jgi:CRISPR-associated protein Csd1